MTSENPPPYFTHANFLDEKDAPVFHGFFGRGGGVSRGIYSALNCGVGSDDNPEDVIQNRKIVARTVGCAPENLLGLHQIHSGLCVPVHKSWPHHEKPQADAMVTDVPGLALSVLTADCAPVLFTGQKPDGAPVIGAAHAGWGGALRGVLEATVKEMEALGAVKDTIRACIGPCIGQESYEVSADFQGNFLAEDKGNARFFVPSARAGHALFDLAGYAAHKLSRAGVGSVFIKNLDTYFHEEDFFSYRRTTHRAEKDYGRQISVVMIKKA